MILVHKKLIECYSCRNHTLNSFYNHTYKKKCYLNYSTQLFLFASESERNLIIMPNVGTYRGVTIYYQEDRDRYRMWYTDNKGIKKPVYGKTIELVKTNYDQIQEQLRKGLYLAKMPDTLLKLMTQMIDEQEEYKELKQNSINRKRDTANIIKEHIKCCKKPIQKITEDNLNEDLKKLPQMKKFIQSKNREEYRFSQSYLNQIYSLIRETFHYAVIKRKLAQELDPFEVKGRVKKPKANKATKEVKPFTRAECIKFLKQLSIEEPSQIIDIIKIQIMGFRIGETLALTNENIDLEERKIYIETSLTKDKDDKTVRGDTTKTPSRKTKLSSNIYITRNYRTLLQQEQT